MLAFTGYPQEVKPGRQGPQMGCRMHSWPWNWSIRSLTKSLYANLPMAANKIDGHWLYLLVMTFLHTHSWVLFQFCLCFICSIVLFNFSVTTLFLSPPLSLCSSFPSKSLLCMCAAVCYMKKIYSCIYLCIEVGNELSRTTYRKLKINSTAKTAQWSS